MNFCGIILAAAIIIPACGSDPTSDGQRELSVTKTGVVNGNVITYTITVKNLRDVSTGIAITVTDELGSAPAGSVLAGPAFCTHTATTVLCDTPGALNGGASSTFTMTVTVPPGVSGDVQNCASIYADSILANNESCVGNTVIAPPNTGTLTIVKVAQPSSSDDFMFTSAATQIGTFMLDDDADPTLSNQKQFVNVPAGTYTIAEVASTEWDLTAIACTPSAAGTVSLANRSVSVAMVANANIICTFTNKEIPAPTGSITIVKATASTQAQDFAFTSNNPSVPAFSLDVDADAALPSQRVFADVPAGSYVITETATPGWAVSGIACTPVNTTTSNVANGSVAITITSGINVTCTFTNTKLAATISSISPASPTGSAGGQVITINGLNFQPDVEVTLRNGTGGETKCTVTLSDCLVSSITTTQVVLNATFGVSASNQVWSVQLQNPGTTATAPTPFTVMAPTPTIVTVVNDPPQVRAGTPTAFTITGTNYSTSEVRVLMTGPDCAPCVVGNSALTTKTNTTLAGSFTYPQAGTYTLKVQNAVTGGAGGTTGPESNAVTVTVASPPTAVITSITPASLTGSSSSQIITIVGRDFVSGLRVIVRNVTDNELVTDCPPFPPGCEGPSAFTSTSFQLSQLLPARAVDQIWSIELINPGATSSGPTQFNVLAATPVIGTVTTVPTSPTAGSSTTFTITGSNFSIPEARVSVTGPNCEPCVIGNASLTKTGTSLSGPITFPSAGTYTFRVQNGVSAGAGGFTGPQSNTVSVTVGAGGAGGAGGFTLGEFDSPAPSRR